jgi:hypothetical protein
MVCVGLDSDYSKIPGSSTTMDVFGVTKDFNARIVAATKDFVCAYKPNTLLKFLNKPENLIGSKILPHVLALSSTAFHSMRAISPLSKKNGSCQNKLGELCRSDRVLNSNGNWSKIN